MRANKLTILTVNYNTTIFIEVMLRILTKTAYYEPVIEICDNGSNLLEKMRLNALKRRYKDINITYRQQSEAGSIAHGEALDILIRKVKTDFFLVIDSDAVILKKNWDKNTIERINNKIKAVGTEATGSKPKDFPLMYAVIFETEAFVKASPSFLPSKTTNPNEDTGYEIREKYHSRGYKGEVWKMQNAYDGRERHLSEIRCAAYYDQQGNLIASHFGRGAVGGVMSIKTKKTDIKLVDWMKKKYIAVTQKRKWVKAVDKIANELMKK